jgi:hypothetical protein
VGPKLLENGSMMVMAGDKIMVIPTYRWNQPSRVKTSQMAVIQSAKVFELYSYMNSGWNGFNVVVIAHKTVVESRKLANPSPATSFSTIPTHFSQIQSYKVANTSEHKRAISCLRVPVGVILIVATTTIMWAMKSSN